MSDETTDKTSATPVGALVQQAHGGALRNGGTNKGGPGRPPSAIRASARKRFDKLMPHLSAIVRDETSKDSDKIRAIEVLGRIGLDRAISIEDVKAALRETNHEIYDFLPRDQADALVARLRPIWRKL
jgi:hypothetical protein